MKVRTDDDVYRFRGVFLGPKGKTLPFHARYLAYGLWLATFPIFAPLLVVVGFPIITALILAAGAATGATIAIMWIVDHDRPLRSWVQVLRWELDAPRTPPQTRPALVTPKFTVRSSR